MNKPYTTALRNSLAAVLLGASALQAQAIIITTTDTQMA